MMFFNIGEYVKYRGKNALIYPFFDRSNNVYFDRSNKGKFVYILENTLMKHTLIMIFFFFFNKIRLGERSNER